MFLVAIERRILNVNIGIVVVVETSK